MLYLLTDTLSEAEPFIVYYRLERDERAETLPVYRNGDTALSITGGDVNAFNRLASAHFTRDNGAWLVCVSGNPTGGVLYPHTLIDAQGRAFYPDMLYRHPFTEGVWYAASPQDNVVMALYAAAVRHLPLHRVIVLKIGPEPVTASSQLSLAAVLPLGVSNATTDIAAWLDSLRPVMTAASANQPMFNEEEVRLMTLLGQNLRLTQSQKIGLHKDCTARKLKGGSLAAILVPFAPITCQTKQEGKEILARVRQSLLE